MRIAYISADWSRTTPPTPGGAGWARVHLPGLALAAAGHEVVIGHGVGGLRDGTLIPLDEHNRPMTGTATEVIVTQRWMHAQAADAILAARAAGQVVIGDVDDWFDGLRTTNQAWWATHPGENPEVNRNHYRAALAACSLITVSTPFLADKYRAMTRSPVEVVRNAIDVSAYTRQPVGDTGEPVVGWVGATSWRSGDLETLQGVLDPWLDRHHGRFTHHGMAHPQDATAYDALGIAPERRAPGMPMVPVADYPGLMAGFDIGIVPLSGSPFNHAKSAIKGMEYAAAGIPYIASSTPEYRWFGQGVIADRPRKWVSALNLLADSARRREVADAAYERVQADDISRRWRDWEALYASARP